jgi:hypothetical protein
MTTLTERQLNRALLARQHLLERSDGPLTTVIEDVGGLQTQYAPSAYIGLWTRMREFERASLTRAMEAREAIHGTLMRVTIHTVSARDYWPMAIGIRRSRQEWVERVTRSVRPPPDFPAAAQALREDLKDGPLKASEITKRFAARGLPPQAVGWGSLWVDVVRIPPSGTWERRSNDLYELADRWLPPEMVDQRGLPTEEEGLRLLLERYLGGFGPAKPSDFANWANVPLSRAKQAIEGADLRRYVDEQGRELVDVPGAPLPDPDTPAPVRFLPTFDPTLLVNCRRTQILPERHRPTIFNVRTPQSVGTVLVDGQVAATWRYHAGAVTTEALEPLTRATQREIEAEADALTRFHTEG